MTISRGRVSPALISYLQETHVLNSMEISERKDLQGSRIIAIYIGLHIIIVLCGFSIVSMCIGLHTIIMLCSFSGVDMCIGLHTIIMLCRFSGVDM